jgi:ferredoxin-NADP reductase/MOSC domain-containing protein YiiM
MRLLNFSTGTVQTVQINGEPVRTAHVKRPCKEPWLVTESGPVGDERAVHPDKIYAYARTGYRYWGAYLNADSEAWTDGFFGENLTFDVLDEGELRVGDVLAVGNEVRLVAAGPRNVCVKLAWRLGQPATFQKVFAESPYTGVYFGVSKGGRVGPSDEAIVIERDPAMPTIRQVAQYILSHNLPPLEALQNVLANPHLSLVIRHILQTKVDAAARAASASEGRWTGWRPFAVDRIVEEARDIRSVYLRPTDLRPVCRPRPGQFVSVRIPIEQGKTITRTWSVSSYAHEMTHYRITVRREQGPGSQWIHGCEVGSSVLLRAPAGEFSLDTGGFRPVVLIAAGIGITPLLAMLHAHLARGPTGIPIYLIYSARTFADQAFRDELSSLAAAHPALHITHAYSRTHVDGRPAGRITVDEVRAVLADLHIMLGEHRVDQPWFENDTYLCGPERFCREFKEELVAGGGNADRIRYELFSAPPVLETSVDAAEIHFARTGVTGHWSADDDLSLLEVAERLGITVPSDCRAGSCLTCKTRILAGEATSKMLDGAALLCVSRPRTPRLVVDC